MKKGFIYVFSLIAILWLGATQAFANSEFSDVSRSHWAYQDIMFLSEKGVIRGHLGKFNPNGTLTRNDAAIMIVRAMGLETPANPKVIPADMTPETRGYYEVVTALDRGMFDLVGTEFKPSQPLSRKEMAQALAVGYGYQGAGQSSFKDVPKNDAYYRFIDAIAKNDITTGYADGTFKPDLELTRLQFSVFLARIYNKPLEYTVKQNGTILHTVKDSEEAIRLALQYPNATVHPVNNSLVDYTDRPAELPQTYIRNGVLIYNGAEQNTQFSAEYFRPYIQTRTGKTLFDTFIILGRSYPEGEFGVTSDNRANYEDWLWYLNETFADDGVLTHLNASAQSIGKKVNVYITIPHPKLKGDIIDLAGKRMANTSDAREKLVSWYIDNVEAAWRSAGFSNLNFVGYYWFSETMGYPQDELLVERVTTMVHNKGRSFIYSPHALSSNFDRWRSYGFDGAYLQPNAFRLKLTDTEARLHRAFLLAQIYQSGINIEIDQYGPHQIEDGLVNFKQYIEMAQRYQLPGQSFIFYQGIGMVDRMIKYNTPAYREAYQLLESLSY